jgi:hypothetical protein
MNQNNGTPSSDSVFVKNPQSKSGGHSHLGSASHNSRQDDIDKQIDNNDEDFYGKSRTPRMCDSKVTPQGHNEHLLVRNQANC